MQCDLPGPGLGSECGDGATCFETESCDDGNTAGGDLCATDCSSATLCPNEFGT